MKTKLLLFIISICMMNTTNSQNNTLPYYEIPDYPSEYNQGTVVARMIDGLGFRYYWATEGLRDEDLAFKPSEEARTTGGTVDHLYGLTKTIINAALKKPIAPMTKPIALPAPTRYMRDLSDFICLFSVINIPSV